MAKLSFQQELKGFQYSKLWDLRFLQFHEKVYVLKYNSCYQLGEPIIDCPNLQWNGDGFCDDSNNIIECNYDGGDCCGSDVNIAYCQQCLCLSNSSTTPSVPPTLFPTLTPGNNTGNNYCLMLYLSKTSFQQEWKGI